MISSRLMHLEKQESPTFVAVEKFNLVNQCSFPKLCHISSTTGQFTAFKALRLAKAWECSAVSPSNSTDSSSTHPSKMLVKLSLNSLNDADFNFSQTEKHSSPSILTRGKWKLTRLLQFLILCFPISSITGATIKFNKCESMNRFSEKDWRDENFHRFNQILCKVQNLLG